MPETPAQPLSIVLRQKSHDWVVPLPNSTAKQQAGQNRRDQNREGQGAQQREGDGQGHGPKQPAFHSLQREDRQVGGDDDGDRVEHRPLHFMRRFADGLGGGLYDRRNAPGSRDIALAAAHVTNDVLDHDHGAVHHHPEVQRTQRQKIGGNFTQVQPDGGKKQRERNGERNNEGRPSIAEKEEENDRDQNHPFRQVVHHRVRRKVKQIATV